MRSQRLVVYIPGNSRTARNSESLLRQQEALAAFGSFAFQEPDLGRVLEEAARICAGSLALETA
jgi:hypothetical protein